MMTAPEPQHAWLKKFVGDWTFESTFSMGPGQPEGKSTGTERCRMIGDLWMMGEGKGEMPGGETGTMIVTIGYDPAKKAYIGSWIGSMMAHMWVYTGTLDAAGKELPLETEGPSFEDPTKTSKYRDTIEWINDNERLLKSSTQGPDGKWTTFMTARYTRKT